MKINYKGYDAELKVIITHMQFIPPDICSIELTSKIANYKVKDITFDKQAETIQNMFKKWFKEKVDYILKHKYKI